MEIVSGLMELIIPSSPSITVISENRQLRGRKVGKQKDSAAESGFSRRSLLQATTLGAVGAALAPALSAGRVFASSPPGPSSVKPFAFAQATISDLQVPMKSGVISSRSLTEAYLARIQEIDKSGPALNSVIEINPDALSIAEALDKERKQHAVRGPMHGIPILIKDNIDTHDRMQTTAGSLALVGTAPPQDATVAAKLRQAGAVILGKANLSEWANFRSTHSSSGWSGRGQQCANPFVLDRSPSGSSSGSAAATSASFCAAALATETNGSIVAPASACGVVGIKPTVGLTSRAGVVPISHTQDTIGVHGRRVADAAAVLGAMV